MSLSVLPCREKRHKMLASCLDTIQQWLNVCTLATGEDAVTVGSDLTAASSASAVLVSALRLAVTSAGCCACFPSGFGGGGSTSCAAAAFFGLTDGVGLRDLELLLQTADEHVRHQSRELARKALKHPV